MTKFAVAAHGIIRDGRKILTLKRSETDDYMPSKWDFPGGVLDPGETLEDGIKREVHEETGLTVTVSRVAYAYADLDELPNDEYVILVYECFRAGGEIKLDPKEHDDSKWVTVEELEALNPMHFIKGWLEQEKRKV